MCIHYEPVSIPFWCRDVLGSVMPEPIGQMWSMHFSSETGVLLLPSVYMIFSYSCLYVVGTLSCCTFLKYIVRFVNQAFLDGLRF